MHYLFLLGGIYLFLNTLHAQIEIWQLDAIPLKNFTIVKNIRERTVYKEKDFYVKIWRDGSWHFQNNQDAIFLQAVYRGFFDDIAPLRAVIMDKKNRCCGYVTWTCQPVSVNSVRIREDKNLLHHLNNKGLISVIQLYARLRKKALETGFCIINDFTGPWNLGILHERCYLIDLDNVQNLQQFQAKNPNWKNILYYLDSKFAAWE